jgi:hypothetical protein
MDYEELLSWWQSVELSPETVGVLQTVGWVFLFFVGGNIIGSMVARRLRGRNFDAALRLPGSSAASADPDSHITPTFVAGMLVRATVWAAGVWWLAHKHGRTDLAATVGLVVSRAWAVAGMLVAVLGLGTLLAQRLIDCLDGPKPASDGLALRNGNSGSQRRVAGAVGAGAYFMVVLLVLLMAADLFDWPLTRSSAQALWGLAQNLLLAGTAMLIGYAGACWARELGTSEGPATPEKRAAQYTAMALVGGTTVLAVGVLLSGGRALLGLAVLAVLGFAIWLVRDYVPDVIAGVKLRAKRHREVWFDGAPWQIADIGFLHSQVSRAGEIHRMQNRVLLEACSHAAPREHHREREQVRERELVGR